MTRMECTCSVSHEPRLCPAAGLPECRHPGQPGRALQCPCSLPHDCMRYDCSRQHTAQYFCAGLMNRTTVCMQRASKQEDKQDLTHQPAALPVSTVEMMSESTLKKMTPSSVHSNHVSSLPSTMSWTRCRKVITPPLLSPCSASPFVCARDGIRLSCSSLILQRRSRVCNVLVVWHLSKKQLSVSTACSFSLGAHTFADHQKLGQHARLCSRRR